MAYTPTNWVDNVTPVDAARMNNIEAGISALGEGIQYENVYAPATAYQPGDVVSYGGVQYLAVNPSTGVTPSGGATGVGYVPQDAVTVAGVRLVSTKLVSTDAQPAFRIMGDGKHEWGAGGASAPDVNLYRPSAGFLHVDGVLRTMHASPTAEGAFWSKVTSEATDRFRVRADGFLQWGDGTLPLDCVIRRDSPGRLTLDNTSFRVGRAAATDAAFATYQNSPGDAAERFVMLADGTMAWGPGNAARDTNLYRYGAGVLGTEQIRSTFSGAGGAAFLASGGPTGLCFWGSSPSGSRLLANSLLINDANHAFSILGSGMMQWGPGGATAVDTNLYRGAANVLQTDDAFKSVNDLLAGQDVYSRQGGTGQIILSQVGVLPCIYLGSALTQRIQVCTGTPEGVITASVGSLALRTDGGASTTLYVKQSGAGNTGWVAK